MLTTCSCIGFGDTTDEAYFNSCFCLLFLQGLIQELVEFNLHEGTPQMRSDVRHLLCLLTKDNEQATKQLNEILISAVGEAVNSHKSNPAVVSIST